jgi:tRNA G10  N-methylase Trm11
MSKYIFILGHSPALSILEITKALPLFSKKFSLEVISPEVLIVNSAVKISEQKILERLGGTVKIGKIFEEMEGLNNSKQLLKKFVMVIDDRIKKNKACSRPGPGIKRQKIKFGFSLYFAKEDLLRKKFWQREFNRLGIKLKRELKDKKVNSRFVVSRNFNLTSVIVSKEKLIHSGLDFIFFIKEKKAYLAFTSACQDFSDYASRDYDRPQKDLLSGMLPVKLAKMMINISQAKEGEIILDPFCGSGTILQEALNLGYKSLIGADENQQAIINSQNNLEWLIKKLNRDSKNYNIQLYHLSVQKLDKKIPAKKIGIIITEPYLGSPFKSRSNLILRREEIKKIENLYYKAFQNFFSILKKNGRVIIVWPVYKIRTDFQEKTIFISETLLKKIKVLGFEQENLTAFLRGLPNFVPYLTKRGTILYFRPCQRVQREILIFQKS